MHKILSPVCLVLALAMLFVGFGLWAVAPPEAQIELHQARVAGDDALTDVLEAELRRRQRFRKLMIAGLFAGGGSMVFAAFAIMRPSGAA